MKKEYLTILTNIIGGVESGGQTYGKRKYGAYAGKTMKKRVHQAGRKIMGMKVEDCVR